MFIKEYKMNDILLKSNILVVAKILRKTKARLFKDLKIGDKITFSVPIKHAGSNRGTTYSTYIETKNVATGEVVLNSFNQLPPLLETLILEEAIDS